MAANGIIQSENGIEKTKIGAIAEPMHPKALLLRIKKQLYESIIYDIDSSLLLHFRMIFKDISNYLIFKIRITYPCIDMTRCLTGVGFVSATTEF